MSVSEAKRLKQLETENRRHVDMQAEVEQIPGRLKESHGTGGHAGSVKHVNLRQRRFLQLAMVVVALTGCDREAADSPLRLMTEAPQRLFDLGEIETEKRQVFSASFARSADLDSWRCRGVRGVCEIREGVLKIHSSLSDPKLVRRVRLAADDISLLEVEASGPRAMQFFWASAGERFSAQRRIALRPKGPPVRGRRMFRARLDQHPLWKGRIGRVRLDPTNVPNQRVEIVRLRGVREEVQLARLDSLAGSAWKVDLGNEVRNAWIHPPGHVISRGVKVPRKAQLRFAFGSVPGVTVRSGDPGGLRRRRLPARFQVSVARCKLPIIMDATCAGEEQSVIFESDYAPRESSGSWTEEAIDLSKYSGEEVRLFFGVQGLPEGDSVDGVPVWDDPIESRKIE